MKLACVWLGIILLGMWFYTFGVFAQGKADPSKAIDYTKCLENGNSEDMANCLILVGNALGIEEKYKGAEQAFREALRVSPNGSAAAYAYSGLGNTLGRQGKYSEAILAFQNAVKIEPTLGSAWADLGIAYLKMGNLDKAIETLKQAISVTHFDAVIDMSYLNLTYAYLLKEDAHNTKESYEILRGRNPVLATKLASELKGNPNLAKRFQSFTR